MSSDLSIQSYVPSNVKYDANEATESYNEESEMYTLEFNTGAKIEYKYHPSGLQATASSYYTDNGYAYTKLTNMIGAKCTGSEEKDILSLINCFRCNVDVVDNNNYDLVSIDNVNSVMAGGNTVKYDKNDSIDDFSPNYTKIGVEANFLQRLFSFLFPTFTYEQEKD